MKASLKFTVEQPEKLGEAVTPGLKSDNQIQYSYSSDEAFKVEVEADRIGSLRGATDNVFRLVSLSERLR